MKLPEEWPGESSPDVHQLLQASASTLVLQLVRPLEEVFWTGVPQISKGWLKRLLNFFVYVMGSDQRKENSFLRASHNLSYKLLQTVRVRHVNSYFQTQNLNRSKSRKPLPAEEATIAICNLWEDFKSPWVILQTSSSLQFIHTPSLLLQTSQALSSVEDRDTSSL